MRRPTTIPEECASHVVQVYLNESDRAWVRAQAADHRLSESAYLRMMVALKISEDRTRGLCDAGRKLADMVDDADNQVNAYKDEILAREQRRQEAGL